MTKWFAVLALTMAAPIGLALAQTNERTRETFRVCLGIAEREEQRHVIQCRGEKACIRTAEAMLRAADLKCSHERP